MNQVSHRPRLRRILLTLTGLWFLTLPNIAEEILPPGFRPQPIGVHALTGATVATEPGKWITNATIVIRRGYIEAVGSDVVVPPDARVWDRSGQIIYAGFIEPYLPLATTNQPVNTSNTQPIMGDNLTAGGVRFFGAPGDQTDTGARGPSYGVAKVTPEMRVVRGYSPEAKTLGELHELGFTAALVTPSRGIVRGTSSLVTLADLNPNETILRADVFQHIAFETHEEGERAYPGSLMGAIAVVRQSFFDAQHYQRDHADWRAKPAGRKRPEFNPALEVLGPAAAGQMPVVFEPGSVLMVDRVAHIARELELAFAIVSCGQEWRRPDLAKAAGATFIVPVNFPALPKLPSQDDWEQVTLDQLRAWDWAAENPALLRQEALEIALTTYGLTDRKVFRKNLKLALERGLTADDALAALTTVPAKLCGVEKQLGTIAPGKLANLTVLEGNGYFDPTARVREVWVEGRLLAIPAAKPAAKAEPNEEPEETNTEAKPKPEKAKRDAELRELLAKRVARPPQELRGPLAIPAGVVLRNARLWTCAPAGVLTNAQLVVKRGIIEGVGDIKTEANETGLELDMAGLHVTPGLIDAHSHTAILGAVNESTLPSTAMVRIGDVVNSETKNLYEQLAGGLTTANLLHGSANPIGGQNQIIKLRDGASPEGLKFAGAPAGIKFALGENVKQANWGEKFTTRFPQSRTGVPPFYRNRFTAAQQYLQSLQEHAERGGAAPRRNLELEALGEILQGRRFIHCHSYRQDEIVAFLRVMEDFGVRVGTLQHVLEGYKVADEIAAHGAGASCFADWWAFKFEVYDAIPQAGSLMRERGVLVSFNSDSSDLARRLNTEAAKAVKFGGTPELEALKFVTINPARQLGIDARVGSLEPGKDADFVVWSGPPLDSRSVVLQTWIDGKKYFDRALAHERATALAQERDALMTKARKVLRLTGGVGRGDSGTGDDRLFFRVALEHQFERVDRGCLDGENH